MLARPCFVLMMKRREPDRRRVLRRPDRSELARSLAKWRSGAVHRRCDGRAWLLPAGRAGCRGGLPHRLRQSSRSHHGQTGCCQKSETRARRRQGTRPPGRSPADIERPEPGSRADPWHRLAPCVGSTMPQVTITEFSVENGSAKPSPAGAQGKLGFMGAPHPDKTRRGNRHQRVAWPEFAVPRPSARHGSTARQIGEPEIDHGDGTRALKLAYPSRRLLDVEHPATSGWSPLVVRTEFIFAPQATNRLGNVRR